MTPPAAPGTTPPLRLRLLGTVEVEGLEAGPDAHPLLRQPKRAAVLVYTLLEGGRGGMVSRERLVEVFWPEGPEEKGRGALRQSLRFLRRNLPDGSIVRRGNRAVGVDSARVGCDVLLFRDLLEEGRPAEALELYRGDLLAGFVVDAGDAFDAWAEGLRVDLRRSAADAAWGLAVRAEQGERSGEAAFWAKRALAVSPFDEGDARRVMALLARTGDATGALEVYDDLERRLAHEGRPPEPLTRRIAEEVSKLEGAGAPGVLEGGGGRRTGVDRRDGEERRDDDEAAPGRDNRRSGEDRRSFDERRSGRDRRLGG